MKPKHRTMWCIFVDNIRNTDEQWIAGMKLVNGWFTKYTRKSAIRLVNKLYREHGVYFFATLHSETRRSHGHRVYKYVYGPREN